MSIPFNNTAGTSYSQTLPPMRKLNFEDDDSTTVTNSVTDIPAKPFSHLFLKKERKIQSDSFLQLQPKKQFDFFDCDNDLPCQPADRRELAGLMNRSLRLPSVGKSLIGMMSSKSTPPCKKTINTEFKGEDSVIKEEPLSGDTVRIEEVPQDSFSEVEEKSEISHQDTSKKDLTAELSSLTQEYANKLSLCTNKNIRDPDLNTISPQTVAGLLYETASSKFIIVDCRYNYEYQGGHIKGAIHIESPEVLEKIFFTHKDLLYNSSFVEDLKKDLHTTLEKLESYSRISKTEENDLRLPLVIFHCEFSQKRGPRAFRLLRAKDRELNIKNWPNLYFSEIYVLDGGYCNFYAQFPEHCEGGYMRMIDKQLKKEFAIAKENDKKMWSKKDLIEVDENE